MSADRKIRDSVEQLLGEFLADKVNLMFGNVVSIQNDTAGFPAYCTVESISGKATTNIENVALQADISDGELKVPVIGSTVIVAYSKYSNPFLAFVSDIESYYYYGNTWQQGDGSFGGWVKVIDLVTKLNNVENLLNDLIGKYNVHTHSGGGGPIGPPTPTEPTIISPITQRSDLENTEATHGV